MGLEVSDDEARHLEELKNLFPEVPHHLVERFAAQKGVDRRGAAMESSRAEESS